MKYRNKPIEIEAMQLTRDNAEHVAAWIDTRPAGCRSVLVEPDGSLNEHFPGDPDTQRLGILIPTPEGKVLATEGDYIVRDNRGYSRCEAGLFEATYEPIEPTHVVCTVCGCAYGGTDPAEPGVGFESQDEAETTVLDAGWWLLTSGPVCDWCGVRQSCRERGHLLTGWQPCQCFGVIPSHTVQMMINRCVFCPYREEYPAGQEPNGEQS